MTRLAALLALLAVPARALETWEVTQPRDPFVSRSGDGEVRELSAGKLGIPLTSWGRRPLYLAWRTLALEPARLAAANEAVRAALARRAEADARKGAVAAWAAARGASAKERGWDEQGVYRRFASDVVAYYVNCAPDAFRLASATLADLRQRKGVKPEDAEAWGAAQDRVFAFCAHEPWPAKPGGEPPPALPFPEPLPAKAPALLRQLRDYQIAAARLYAGDHEGALSRFDAIARAAGHPMRGWAAVATLRAVARGAALDLGLDRAWAASRAPGADPEQARARLAEARARRKALEAEALRDLRARAAGFLAKKELAAVHDVVRSTLDDAVRQLAPREWWGLAAGRLAQVEQHPLEDDGTLLRWAEVVGDPLDLQPEPELGALRRAHAFVDWIATLQACTDSPASPHARGRCAEEHSHALEVWGKRKEPAWLVAALVTARQLGPAEEPLVQAGLRVSEQAPEWLATRYHAARLLGLAGRRAEALPLADAGLVAAPRGTSAWHLLVQQRLALATTVAELGPYLVRATGRQGVQLGADGERLLDRVLSSEDLLELVDAPGTPRELARELLPTIWFRAHLAGKPEVALAAARRVRAEHPRMAESVGFYLEARDPVWRHEVMMLIATDQRISPQHGWRRARREVPWWCTFEPALASAQEAIERVPPAPVLPPRAGASRDEEQVALRELGFGSSYAAQQLLVVVPKSPLKRSLARDILAEARKATAAESCPNPDGARWAAELERAIGALR